MTGLPLWEKPVNYGAVGGTQAEDLLRYPPAGYRPVERRVRVGHGDERWEFAWMRAMTWGIQRDAGFVVETTDTPAEVSDLTYTPVGFDGAGNPVEPATASSGGDTLFGHDGTPFIRPGDTAKLLVAIGPFTLGAPVRVIYVIDEPDRKGFAYGTLPGHPISGEEAWLVQRSEDGSVWLTIRAFSRPATWVWWIVYPVIRLMQEVYTRRYERSLARPISE